MDAEGNCLVVGPCSICMSRKNGVQTCILKGHNARLISVTKDNLLARHRQCVKPDQAMTIFKLVDRDTGEECIEFAQQMVFQRPCNKCQGLKSCILSGHKLIDWVGSTEGKTPTTPKRPPAPNKKKRKTSAGGNKGKQKTPKKEIPVSEDFQNGSQATTPLPPSEGELGEEREGAEADREEMEEEDRGVEDDQEEVEQPKPKRARKKSANGTRVSSGPVAASAPAVLTAPLAAVVGNGDKSVSEQLEGVAEVEDALLEQYQNEIQRLSEAEAAKVAEIKQRGQELENIRKTRMIVKSETTEQRNLLAAERQRLTELRLQEVRREQDELRRQREARWSACEPLPSAKGQKAGVTATCPEVREALGLVGAESAVATGGSGSGGGWGTLHSTIVAAANVASTKVRGVASSGGARNGTAGVRVNSSGSRERSSCNGASGLGGNAAEAGDEGKNAGTEGETELPFEGEKTDGGEGDESGGGAAVRAVNATAETVDMDVERESEEEEEQGVEHELDEAGGGEEEEEEKRHESDGEEDGGCPEKKKTPIKQIKKINKIPKIPAIHDTATPFKYSPHTRSRNGATAKSNTTITTPIVVEKKTTPKSGVCGAGSSSGPRTRRAAAAELAVSKVQNLESITKTGGNDQVYEGGEMDYVKARTPPNGEILSTEDDGVDAHGSDDGYEGGGETHERRENVGDSNSTEGPRERQEAGVEVLEKEEMEEEEVRRNLEASAAVVVTPPTPHAEKKNGLGVVSSSPNDTKGDEEPGGDDINQGQARYAVSGLSEQRRDKQIDPEPTGSSEGGTMDDRLQPSASLELRVEASSGHSVIATAVTPPEVEEQEKEDQAQVEHRNGCSLGGDAIGASNRMKERSCSNTEKQVEPSDQQLVSQTVVMSKEAPSSSSPASSMQAISPSKENSSAAGVDTSSSAAVAGGCGSGNNMTTVDLRAKLQGLTRNSTHTNGVDQGCQDRVEDASTHRNIKKRTVAVTSSGGAAVPARRDPGVVGRASKRELMGGREPQSDWSAVAIPAEVEQFPFVFSPNSADGDREDPLSVGGSRGGGGTVTGRAN